MIYEQASSQRVDGIGVTKITHLNDGVDQKESVEENQAQDLDSVLLRQSVEGQHELKDVCQDKSGVNHRATVSFQSLLMITPSPKHDSAPRVARINLDDKVRTELTIPNTLVKRNPRFSPQ